MLNDGDSNHGGGEVKDADALFSKLKRNVKADYNSKGQVNWRKEARRPDRGVHSRSGSSPF